MGGLSLHMPLWAIFYSGLLLASAAGTIMISPRKDLTYVFAELLSGILSVMFFLFYYQVLPYPSSLITVSTMLIYIIHQEAWINRPLYSFLKDDSIPKKEQRFTLLFTAIFFLIALSPFIWVLIEVFKHFL